MWADRDCGDPSGKPFRCGIFWCTESFGMFPAFIDSGKKNDKSKELALCGGNQSVSLFLYQTHTVGIFGIWKNGAYHNAIRDVSHKDINSIWIPLSGILFLGLFSNPPMVLFISDRVRFPLYIKNGVRKKNKKNHESKSTISFLAWQTEFAYLSAPSACFNGNLHGIVLI